MRRHSAASLCHQRLHHRHTIIFVFFVVAAHRRDFYAKFRLVFLDCVKFLDVALKTRTRLRLKAMDLVERSLRALLQAFVLLLQAFVLLLQALVLRLQTVAARAPVLVLRRRLGASCAAISRAYCSSCAIFCAGVNSS